MTTVTIADPLSYAVTIFDDPDAPATPGHLTLGNAINNHGEITGYYVVDTSPATVFGYTASLVANPDGSFTVQDFATVTDINTGGIELTGINNAGDVVGTARAIDNPGTSIGISDAAGSFTQITNPNEAQINIFGTNNLGDVVGFAQNVDGSLSTYDIINGALSTFNVPGNGTTAFTIAYGINDSQDVVGNYSDSLGTHGFLLSKGIFTTLNVPGAVSGTTQVYGINNNGLIVGDVELAPSDLVPFTYQSGVFTLYENVQVLSNIHLGINDLDEIVGTTVVGGVGERGFVITPNAVACYAGGTCILTQTGEIPIENLAVGDHVVTLSGALRPIKWIGRRAYASGCIVDRRDLLPIRIRAGALSDNVPHRDLLVSTLHALYVDGGLVAADLLVNGTSIAQMTADGLAHDPLEYFHVELAAHDIILAEGAQAESYAPCENRDIFSNAADHTQRYPDDATPQRVFCAPHVTDGPALEAIRARINARAALPLFPANPGPLIGHIDTVDPTRIAGWARDERNPHIPVRLEICDGPIVIARITAQRRRPDLEQAGFGEGRHGFDLPHSLDPNARHSIHVRRESDGQPLHASPIVFSATRPPWRGRSGYVA